MKSALDPNEHVDGEGLKSLSSSRPYPEAREIEAEPGSSSERARTAPATADEDEAESRLAATGAGMLEV